MAGLGVCYGSNLEGVDVFFQQESPNLERWRQFLDTQEALHGRQHRQDLMEMRKMREKIAKSVLAVCFGSHSLVNAFEGIDFGSGGCIHTATVTDIMHSLEEGIISYI
ncbi:hypothetical protein G9A89_000565, partial [Geosiphon pyriformis]